ncbi:ankyrin repeat-containing domain protein [Aspergillus californicus]
MPALSAENQQSAWQIQRPYPSRRSFFDHGESLPLELERLLEYSVQGGHLELVLFVLAKGVNISKPNPNATPLFVAAEGNHAHIVKALLDYGANHSAQWTLDNYTALNYASKLGHLKTVETLLAAGADTTTPQ